MGKRILLFLITNILVVVTITIILQLFGVGSYVNEYGLDIKSLAIFSLLWGMIGSIISLLLSKFMAKMMMGVKVIDPSKASDQQAQLVETVHRLARAAGLTKMPEVGIYDSDEVNAFATGPTRSNSLVAVSAGLLGKMDASSVEGVLGHEISHIANGDMVTMTLLQGIINAFVLFLSRVVAYAITSAMRSSNDNGRSSSWLQFLLVIVFQIVFSILGSMVVAAFSRHREYRADAGGAKFAGREKMISALKRLQALPGEVDARAPSLASMKISNKRTWMAVLSTHPPLEDRIARLQAG